MQLSSLVTNANGSEHIYSIPKEAILKRFRHRQLNNDQCLSIGILKTFVIYNTKQFRPTKHQRTGSV